MKENKKNKYETPCIIPLGELARGSGACRDGSGVSASDTGGGSCGAGTNANAACNTGTTPAASCSFGEGRA